MQFPLLRSGSWKPVCNTENDSVVLIWENFVTQGPVITSVADLVTDTHERWVNLIT